MSECIKRQKVVKRGKNGIDTRFRCMNKQCGVHGEEVDDGVCSRCPVKVLLHERPCKKPSEIAITDPNNVGPPVTTDELVNVSDDEIKEMIEDAGLDIEDINKPMKIEGTSLPPEYPPMTMQMWTYKEALLRWAKAGRPKRTQEEVEQLHSQFCSKCDWYDKEQSRCKGCGCKVTTGGLAVFNKLKMATEKCPKGNF